MSRVFRILYSKCYVTDQQDILKQLSLFLLSVGLWFFSLHVWIINFLFDACITQYLKQGINTAVMSHLLDKILSRNAKILFHLSESCILLFSVLVIALFSSHRMQKMQLCIWEVSKSVVVKSEPIGPHVNYLHPKVHKKVRCICLYVFTDTSQNHLLV